MRATIVSLLAAGLCTVAATPAVAGDSTGSETPPVFSDAISADSLRAYDKSISADAMHGRQPGTPGGKRASQWVADQLANIGVEPGNDGSWFQQVPTVATTLQDADDTDLTMEVAGDTLDFAHGTDMMAVTLQQKRHVAVDASDVVFVGYGIDDADADWNDYADVDVEGKTVVVLVNDPGFATGNDDLFDGRTMTYQGRWTYKYEECARQGAAMCLIVHQTDAAGYPWSVVADSWGGTQLALPQDDDTPHVPVAGWLTHDAAERLFDAAGKDFDALQKQAATRGFQPVSLDATASIDLDSTVQQGHSRNVLGVIKGREKPDEAIIYSAHWDHLGENPNATGDGIYNGAVDNGSGVAALLDIARAFAQRDQAPRRSVLFLIPTLEESGLLGSQHYVRDPVFPLDHTVADINVDMLNPIGATKNMQIVGSGHSQLEDRLENVLHEQDRYAIPDQQPQNGFYYRSDHFNFARAGVPALWPLTGNDKVDGGKEAGSKALADFTANCYHDTCDEFDPDADFTGVANDVQALYEVGRQLADGDAWPEWNKGVEFRDKRQTMMSGDD